MSATKRDRGGAVPAALFVDNSVLSSLEKKDSGSVKGKNKKSNVTSSNWKQRATELERAEEQEPNGPGSPLVNRLDDKQFLTFPTGRPLEDDPEPVVCKHCKKPVIKSHGVSHIKACLKAKAEKAKERKKAKEAAAAAALAEERRARGEPDPEDEDGTPGAKKKKVGAKKAAKTDGGAKGKKRKAEGDLPEAKEKKQKKKKEKPVKPAPKPKEPVDVETKCGVPLPQGGYCARSLTCKSHSMGAKRAVPGRSQPYDILLAQHQKKNQARIQKQQMQEKHPDAAENDANESIDSDEETEQVMYALSRYKPVPIVQPVQLPLGKVYAQQHIQSLFRSALDQSQKHRETNGTLGVRIVNGVPEPQTMDYSFGGSMIMEGIQEEGGVNGLGRSGSIGGKQMNRGSIGGQGGLGRKSSLSQSISQTA